MRHGLPFLLRAAALAVLLCVPGLGAAESPATGETLLLRYPDIHRDFVVFVHGGDIWRVPAVGGVARRLTSHPGEELFPQISPDGKWVAYSAEYTGSRQVFLIPAKGGDSRQLTYQTDVGVMPPRGGYDNWILGWSPEGKILVRMNRTPWGQRMGRYFLVDPAGGQETALELPEGGSASFSPDGRKLAYCPISREFRTWKRTRGGRAQDIWIYDLDEHRSTRVTSSRATENFPLWTADTLYFTSDRAGVLNLYAHDLDDGTERAVTRFEEFDVLWPSQGPEAIVFMNGGRLHRLGLVNQAVRPIPVRIGSHMPGTAPYFANVRDSIDDATVSPGASRVILSARGELFSVPAKHGPTRNITRTPGTREMSPAWSPDGTQIAYLSDATGRYEIWVRPEKGEPRQVTHDAEVWRFPPVWSPDSTRLAFGDRNRRLWILEVASGTLTEVDRAERRDLDVYVWSPDSRWLVYEKAHPTRLQGLALYSLDAARTMMLGDGLTNDYDPAFSADGKHLFFVSDRDYNLTFSTFEFNYVYTRSARVYATALDPRAPALFPRRSDEVRIDGDDEGDDDEPNGGAKSAKKKKDGARKDGSLGPEALHLDGWVARTIGLPGLEPGDYSQVQANADAVFYVRRGQDGPPSLVRFDLEEREEAVVAERVDAYLLSPDGKKLLTVTNDRWAVVQARAGQDPSKSELDLSDLNLKLDPRREWAQIYEDAWRITRDWFYDPKMHGKDWEALGRRYRALVPHVATRGDLDFVLGELISELDAGHTYVTSGDQHEVERVEGGTLGCEFEADGSGRYRIARIFPGENWDERFRSPLTEPGVDVREGQYLLAIDGVELTDDDHPFRLLEGRAGDTMVLTVHDRPTLEGAREVTVVPVSGDLDLRYLDWVKSRMALTDRLSQGRVGYIHLPDTFQNGNRMLQKLFYSQVSKPALIVDDRYNGGGFIPDRMIEYLGRRTLAYWAQRDIESFSTPGFAHDGPKAMLINGYSSSGGDALPFFFRRNGLGPLIGTRTWGGLIGLTGNPSFVDGGAVRIPTFRIYDPEGRWVVENEGVVPDIEVIDLPELRIAGGDPSIEKAVEVLLDQLERQPAPRPVAPPPPDLSR